MRNKTKFCLIAFLFIAIVQLNSFAQSLNHPHIWIKDSEKGIIWDKINNYQWARNLYEQYRNRVDPKKDVHKSNPAAILDAIPGLPGDRTAHRETLTLGYEAALLYWLTGDTDYGQLAADILYCYTKNISKISGNINFYNTTDILIQARELYTKPPMIYDFVYNFLKQPTTKVYDRDTDSRVAFNFTKAENTFKKLADNIFNRGSINSNHPILEGPGALFNVLSIDNDATRASYLDKFLNGTAKQNGLFWMMNRCKSAGVWPEATGYSIGPHRIILEMMYIVERYKPSLRIIDKNKDIVKNAFFFENYRYPNKINVMRFGDAHRDRLDTKKILERAWVISDLKAYGILKNDAMAMLGTLYKESGGFNPSVFTQTLEWNNPYYLLWGFNIDTSNAVPIAYNSSININYAGIAMQRNINTTEDVSEYGLMGYTGGAHYVHSHLTGIDIELYGLGGVMGTGGGDVGASDRDDPVFRNYHRIYAGHNTVIINGTSKGRGQGAWKADNQLFQSQTTTVAAEPSHHAAPISPNFSFSAQELNDEVNNALQQRVFSIVRTGSRTGYYFDLFRSKSLSTNNYHDYVYHNVGDGISVYDENNVPLQLTSQPGRYQSFPSVYNGSTIMFPGWHYFEDVKTSSKTTASVKATIPMTKEGVRYMNISLPGGEQREYTTCKGPATIEGQFGYTSEKTPILSVRNYGEAWTKPFIAIFEPSRIKGGTVKSVVNLYNGSTIVGARVVSEVDGKTITDYIIANSNEGEVFSLKEADINFVGRFAIVRLETNNGTTNVSLYIGDGETLSYKTLTLNADSEKKGLLETQLGEVNVALTAPVENAVYTVGDTITLKASASNPAGSITKVNFRINKKYFKQVKTAPYQVDWVPTEPGVYVIDAVAYDDNGASTVSSEITVEVKNVNMPPVVSITDPITNSILQAGETVKIKASVTDEGSITKVNFRINKKFFKQVQTAPYQVDWVPTEPGVYVIDAVAYDDNGASTVSSEITVEVKNVNMPPVVSITDPITNSILQAGQTVKIKASVTDEGSITKVNFRINKKFFKQVQTAPYQVDWTPEAVGNYTIDAVAYDIDNQAVYSNEIVVDVVDQILGVATNSDMLKGAQVDSSVALDGDRNEIVIYPNPAKSYFNINLGIPGPSKVLIYDSNGILRCSRIVTGKIVRFSTLDVYTSGFYIVKIFDSKNNVYVRKLIIQ